MSAIALEGASTFSLVGAGSTVSAQKKPVLERQFVEHLAEKVTEILRDFETQTAAEKTIGLSQSHLSQLARGQLGQRGVGLDALIRLRDYSGLSIDELLGLPPPTKKRRRGSSVPAPVLVVESEDSRLARLERDVSRIQAVLSMMATEIPGRRWKRLSKQPPP